MWLLYALLHPYKMTANCFILKEFRTSVELQILILNTPVSTCLTFCTELHAAYVSDRDMCTHVSTPCTAHTPSAHMPTPLQQMHKCIPCTQLWARGCTQLLRRLRRKISCEDKGWLRFKPGNSVKHCVGGEKERKREGEQEREYWCWASKSGSQRTKYELYPKTYT